MRRLRQAVKTTNEAAHVGLPSLISAVHSEHHPLATLTGAAIGNRPYTFVLLSASAVGRLIMEAHPCTAPMGQVSLTGCSPATLQLSVPSHLNAVSQPHGGCLEGIR